MEVVNFLECLEVLLELIFNFKGKTTPVIVESLAKVIFVKIFLQGFTKGIKDHGHVESSESSLKANFVSCFFKNNFFTFVFFVGMVKLRNL